MHIRKFVVMGGALAAFVAATCAVGCSGQSAGLGTGDGAIADAAIAETSFDSSTVDAAPDAASMCPPHQVVCGGVCTDTRFDPSACGSCTNSCGPGEVCASSACASTCPATEAVCKDGDGGLRCADALTDNANCGYCGNVCGPGTICSNGKCSVTCGADQTKCTAGNGTAYCANLQTDPDDCNTCGHACPLGTNAASRFCSSGTCGVTCNNGALDCNHDPADGCEVYPSTDRANCGACGNICPVGASCSGGGCTCGTIYGQTIENCNGTCTNVQRDPANCGSCGTRCTAVNVYQSADCVESACATANRAVITTTAVTSVALDDTYVYFVRQGTGIQRVSKESTAETPVNLIPDTTAYGIAINAGTIFWTDGSGVFKCPVTGCVGSPKAVSDVPSSGSRIVVDDTNFYWTLNGGGINKCAQTGCNDAPVRMTTQYTFAMATGGSSLFVTAQSSYPYPVESISVSDPPTITSVASTTTYSSGLAYDGSQIYWANGQYIDRCDPASCVPTVVAAIPVSYSSGQIVADSTAVIWASDGIHETVLATSNDSVIANIKSNVTQLALDATDVYWAASDGVYWAPR